MADEIHQDDIGVTIQLEITRSGVALDISTATTYQIKLAAPDMTTTTYSGTFTTDGSDGLLEYTTVADDLDQHGIWQAEAYCEFPNGDKWHSSIGTFEVYPNL